MEYKEIINKIKPEMEKAMKFLENELAKIRTGRVSLALVEDIEVECFEQKFPLKQLGALTVAGPREIVVQPWDKTYLEPIEKAVSRASSGASVAIDQDKVRVSFPALSEEYRKDIVRVLADKLDNTRQTIRHWRGEAWKEVQEKERAGEIREDDKFRAKDDLQKLVDEHNKKIDEMGENKRKEIES